MTAAQCVVCQGSGPFPTFFQGNGCTLVRCSSCRLVFQHPQPTDEVLDTSYYHDPQFAKDLLGPYRGWTLAHARAKLEALTAIKATTGFRRVLDVGCSSGAWLEVAEQQGWRAQGVEIGETVSSAARERGLDVLSGTLAEVAGGLDPQSFDLVSFWDVLEHVRDPREELALSRSLLRSGGIVAATFPNVEGWYPRLTYRLFGRTVGVWEYPELPVHLFDFSPRTARQLFEGMGYTVIGTQTFATPFDFYRSTTLSWERLGRGRKGRALRLAFETLRTVVYPLAALADRGNWVMIVAEHRPRT